MTLSFHWFLPTYGDSRNIVGGGHGMLAGAAGAFRPATLEYMAQVARTADQLGFTGALVPTGPWCEDAWITAAMLTGATERLKFLIALRPGLTSPTIAAQMAATFQRYSRGRLLLNVVVGGEAHDQRGYGDFHSKRQRYERADEFLQIARRLWDGGAVTFRGEHLSIEDGSILHAPDPVPPIYLGGSSADGIGVGARHADVYLTWGEPPPQVDLKLRAAEAAADAVGRKLAFGVRLHVISRDTSEQAWAEAERQLRALDPKTIAAVQAGLARSESEGQRRMVELHNGKDGDLEIYPNLWAGVGLVRGGAGTALVGSHTEVANLICEYADLGISEFIMSGHPHIEEAYWFAEGVLPILRARGLWGSPADDLCVEEAVPFAGLIPDPRLRAPASSCGRPLQRL